VQGGGRESTLPKEEHAGIGKQGNKPRVWFECTEAIETLRVAD